MPARVRRRIRRWPEDGTLFHLFNPFSREVLAAFAARAARAAADLRILYVNAAYVDVFAAGSRRNLEPPSLPSEFHPAVLITPRPRS